MNEPIFHLNSSNGQLCCSAVTGRVLREESSYSRPNDAELWPFNHTTHIDIAEWRQAYPQDQLEGLEHDILDFGLYYLDENGAEQYTPPDEDWRQEFRAMVKAGALHGIKVPAAVGKMLEGRHAV